MYARCLTAFSAAALVAGLTLVRDVKAADQVLTDSVVLLDRAIAALASPDADYTTPLRTVLSAWPAQGRGFVKAELAVFLDRIPDSRADFRCSADFVRYRARKELVRLKDTLLDSNPQPAQPQFCYASPFAIDPTQPIARIEIYGYDFDRQPTDLLLMDEFGFQDVTFAVVKRTHYHLTLELDKNGLRISPANQRLALTMDHLIQHAIPVIQPDTRLCESRVETMRAGKTVSYAPPLVESGRRFSGRGAEVLAAATLDHDSNQINATVCMTAMDRVDHRSAGSGCAVEVVYSADSDRIIDGVLGGLDDQIAMSLAAGSGDARAGSSRGPVAQWIVAGLGLNSADPEIKARLRSSRLVTTRIGSCVPVVDYLEAKRMQSLAPATVRRLDPALKRIDPVILNLRPRFAPKI